MVIKFSPRKEFLDDCLDKIFSGASLLPICPTIEYSGDLIQRLFTIGNTDFFYIGSITSILHVNCPSIPLFIAHLRQDALILSCDPRCTLTLKTQDGSVRKKAIQNNDTAPRIMSKPQILATYNYKHKMSSNDIHRIVTYSVIGGVFVLLFIFTIVAVIVFYWKKRSTLYFPQSCTFRRSSSPTPSFFNRTI